METRSWNGNFYGSKSIGSDTLEGLCVNIGTFASATLEQALKEDALPVLRELIERDVYNKYKGTWADAKGNRTYELEDAWAVRRVARGFFDTVEIYIDDGKINYNWDYLRNPNGHLASHSISRIEDLANIVNNGMNYQPPMNFPQMSPRPFWDDFLDWLERDFAKKFQERCAKYGVKMVIGGGKGITIDRD